VNKEHLDNIYFKLRHNLLFHLKYYLEPLKKHYFKILIFLIMLVASYFLFWFPHWQVSQFGINNATVEATLENQYRTTLAQIFGGVTIGIGLYYTWQRNNIAHEGQITERFTRAVDQLGNRKLEIRLGAIYALERIARESDKDYWQIMEILTAYIRKNSSNDSKEMTELEDINIDIQAILTVLKRRKYSFTHGENNTLNLKRTNLQNADLEEINLYQTNLCKANLSQAYLMDADLSWADLEEANLSHAVAAWAAFSGTDFTDANLSDACFFECDINQADFFRADLSGTVFERVGLREAKNLTVEQLLKTKTLHGTELDDKLEGQVRAKKPNLLDIELEVEELIPFPVKQKSTRTDRT